MASTSSRQLQATTILLVAALLFLVCTTRGQAARPEPGSKDHMPQLLLLATRRVAARCLGWKCFKRSLMRKLGATGKTKGEECLMRRTLQAHIDYIYTQGKHN